MNEIGRPEVLSPAAACTAHPGAAALYRCDGCGRRLCGECVVESTRLMLCAHCGELALPLPADLPEEPGPLAAPAPTPPPLDSRAGLRALLGYPLRGRQGALFAGLALLLAGVAGLERFAGEAGCVVFLPFALLLLLFPGLLGDVTRNAAQGLGDLLEWPDYRAPGGRAREALLYYGVGALALIPASALLLGFGCVDRLARGAGLGLGCALVLGTGLWPSALLWMPLWGAAATTGSLQAALAARDQLARAARAPHALAAAATIGWGAMLLGPTLRALLPAGSLAGILAEALPGAWGAIVAARAAGLLRAASEEKADASPVMGS